MSTIFKSFLLIVQVYRIKNLKVSGKKMIIKWLMDSKINEKVWIWFKITDVCYNIKY